MTMPTEDQIVQNQPNTIPLNDDNDTLVWYEDGLFFIGIPADTTEAYNTYEEMCAGYAEMFS